MGKENTGKLKNAWKIVPALLIPLGVFAVLAGRYDFYFDLNDDLFMQHILSGTYTGVPESRNIQSLYPLSFLLSRLYAWMKGVEWYGTLLLLCQFGALGLMIFRILTLRRGKGHRLLAVCAAAAAYTGLLLYHLVYVQYSVTVGLLAGAAMVLILTKEDRGMPAQNAAKQSARQEGNPLPEDDDAAHSVRSAGTTENRRRQKAILHIGAAALLWLAYVLRSEMMLFLLPFVLLAFLTKTALEEVQVSGTMPLRKMAAAGALKRTVLRFCSFAVILLVGIAGLRAADEWGYRDPAWQEFRALFDARTQLYDFQARPAYEGNEEFYESIGLAEEQVILLHNYNFTLDEAIDASVMQETADYAAALAAQTQSFGERIRIALWDYRHSLYSEENRPYNLISAALFLLAFMAVCVRLAQALNASRRDPKASHADLWSALISLACILALFAGRSLLWLYLEYHHRPVVRLTHPMCLMECILLMWILFSAAGREKKSRWCYCLAAVTIPAFLYGAAMQCGMINSEYDRRAALNAPYNSFLAYCEEPEHAENFYVFDVYSTVDYSEKIFDNDLPRPLNWDLCGGWVAKSPLQRSKWALYSAEPVREALISNATPVFFVAKSSFDLTWLEEYYRYYGKEIKIVPVDEIADTFTVYQLRTD